MAEETERGLRAQQETARRFSDPFVRSGDAGASQSQMWPDGRGPHSANEGADQGGAEGSAQSSIVRAEA
jgi:hypothetical protein